MIQRCLYCAYEGELIFVHGHYQCRNCRCNIIPCCDGACPDEELSYAVSHSVGKTESPVFPESPSSTAKEIQYSLFS